MKKQDIRHYIKAGTICMNRNRYSYDKLSNGENKDNVKSLSFLFLLAAFVLQAFTFVLSTWHKVLNINTKHKRHRHMHLSDLRKRLFRLAGKPI